MRVTGKCYKRLRDRLHVHPLPCDATPRKPIRRFASRFRLRIGHPHKAQAQHTPDGMLPEATRDAYDRIPPPDPSLLSPD